MDASSGELSSMTIIMMLIMGYLGWLAWRLHRVFVHPHYLLVPAGLIVLLVVAGREMVNAQRMSLGLATSTTQGMLIAIVVNLVLALLAYAIGNALARKFAAKPE
jgi:uncharacterized membrane protein YjgN (DUF898 family)